jgi:hypothetical protein
MPAPPVGVGPGVGPLPSAAQVQASTAAKRVAAGKVGAKKPAATPLPAGGETHNADALRILKRIDERLRVRLSAIFVLALSLLRVGTWAIARVLVVQVAGSQACVCVCAVPSSLAGLLQYEHSTRGGPHRRPVHVGPGPGAPAHQGGHRHREPVMHVRWLDAVPLRRLCHVLEPTESLCVDPLAPCM